MLVFGILVGLFVLVLLVVLHELGHAIVAKRNGVVVKEFGIGFPPAAWKKKLKNGVLFSINWLPLGGFVQLQGEHDSANKKGDYGAASFWVKTKILLAGVFINWVTAALLLTVISLVGLPKIIPNQFSIQSDSNVVVTPLTLASVEAGYPAEQAGFQPGDVIKTVAGESIDTAEKFIEVTKNQKGNTVAVEFERSSEDSGTVSNLTADVELRDADSAVFGAALSQSETVRSTWSAPIVGVVTTFQYTGETLKGLGNLVGDFFGGLFGQLSTNEQARSEAKAQLDRAGASVSGPVGILGVIFPSASEAGLTQVLLLTAIVSLTLAVMNFLPIPSLDGGRWFVTALFRLMKKPLTKDLEEKIHGTGFMILMLIIIMVTVADVAKLF